MACKRRGETEDQQKGNEQPLREQRELEKQQKRMETRQACLNQATLEPDLIEDLLLRKTLE
jgi:hypothetical protein